MIVVILLGMFAEAWFLVWGVGRLEELEKEREQRIDRLIRGMVNAAKARAHERL